MREQSAQCSSSIKSDIELELGAQVYASEGYIFDRGYAFQLDMCRLYRALSLQFFRDLPTFIKVNYRGFRRPILSYAYIFFVLFGFGYCIFRGTEATLQFIPQNWRSYSEDGDSLMWVGDDLAFIIAFFGSQVLVQEMLKVAHRLQDYERDRKQFRR